MVLDLVILYSFRYIMLQLQITPSKPLSTPLKDAAEKGKTHSPYSMVPHGRSPVRPSSNDSCTMVNAVENGGSHKPRGLSNGDDNNEGQSLSPLFVKQEPGSPSANVSEIIIFETSNVYC